MQKCKNNNKTNLGEAEKINKNKTGSQYIYIYKDLQVAISCHQVFLY